LELVAELERTKADLERSNRELEDFCYIASHDLKEPLRGMRMYASSLVKKYGDCFDDDGRARLNSLMRLGDRLQALIDSLLDFSRVGRIDLAVGPTDLNDVLRDVLDSLRATLDDAGVDLRLPHPLPTVECDQARIGEVFRNLIANAIKYNDKPTKWIEIGAIDDLRAPSRQTASFCHTETGVATANGNGQNTPVLYVRDNGIGIRERDRTAIFRIFRRLHGREEFGGGTGAGLTIVKKIVDRHGGRIWVESELGEGTTFYFTLGQNKSSFPAANREMEPENSVCCGSTERL
jgi:light-regulated signal transduction histidine kinase (bacteriophytochrome)